MCMFQIIIALVKKLLITQTINSQTLTDILLFFNLILQLIFAELQFLFLPALSIFFIFRLSQ